MFVCPRFILGTTISWEDLHAAKNNKLPPSITSKDVGSALEALHNSGGSVLGVLHSFGYQPGPAVPIIMFRFPCFGWPKMLCNLMLTLQKAAYSILATVVRYTRGLLNSLRFPERRRLKSMSTYATLGLLPRGINLSHYVVLVWWDADTWLFRCDGKGAEGGTSHASYAVAP